MQWGEQCFETYLTDEVRCAIRYHLYNLKYVKNTHGGVLLLVVKLLQPATLLKVTLLRGCFSRFCKLYKWYQIAQRITDMDAGLCGFFYFLFSNGTCRSYLIGYHGIDNNVKEMDVCLLHMKFLLIF